MIRLEILKSRIVRRIQRELSVYYVVRAHGIFRHLKLQKNDILLDCGCGYGVWTSTCASQGCIVVAMDIEAKRVHATRDLCEQQAYSSAVFLVASATALPFKTNSFNKILSIDVLDTIPDDYQVITEISRTLQSDGIFIATVLLKDRPHYLVPIRFPEHIRNYSISSLTHLLESGGLEIQEQFSFYYMISTIAWEIISILRKTKLLDVPGTGLLAGILFSSLARLDSWKLLQNAGIGIVTKK